MPGGATPGISAHHDDVLFICSRNRRRSPTAERIFADWPGLETASAGLAPDAEEPVTPELLQWAELIFVMERAQKARLSRQFGPWLRQARIICLDIPDAYAFMDPTLIALLRARVPRHFRSVAQATGAPGRRLAGRDD